MAKSITEISYEKDKDILSLWKEKTSQVSIEVGDFIIDIDSRGFVAGLEILNASENLNLPSEFLAKIERASMSVLYKQNYVLIMLAIKVKDKDKAVSIPLTIALGHKKPFKEEVIFVKN